jgi:hypothetical protein
MADAVAQPPLACTRAGVLNAEKIKARHSQPPAPQPTDLITRKKPEWPSETASWLLSAGGFALVRAIFSASIGLVAGWFV